MPPKRIRDRGKTSGLRFGGISVWQTAEKKIPIFYDLCYTNSINLKFYRGIVMERKIMIVRASTTLKGENSGHIAGIFHKEGEHI